MNKCSLPKDYIMGENIKELFSKYSGERNYKADDTVVKGHKTILRKHF
jgi:hypothetical protein